MSNLVPLQIVSPEEFAKTTTTTSENRAPLVVRGLNIGCCCEKWRDPEYLKGTVGKKPVAVHVCAKPQMDFLKKNFCYKTLNFDVLVDRCVETKHSEFFLSEDETYYLRSLGQDQRKEIANLQTDFPSLYKDMELPEEIPKDKIFSSVLRVSSSSCQMWTHYDIMDNLLIQVVGEKEVTLWAPHEVPNLYLSGDKSEVMDIKKPDLDRFPKFSAAIQYHGKLCPGDALYIPALWFHNTTSVGFSISINVFWKELDSEFYDNKDLYGNKDLIIAQRTQQSIEKNVGSLRKLPEPYRTFYGLRTIEFIKKSLSLD